MLRFAVLDGAYTPGLLSGHAPPVLIAELDAAVGAQTDGKEEEQRPKTRDDQADREEGERCARHDEGSG